jgi:hypothetical protein
MSVRSGALWGLVLAIGLALLMSSQANAGTYQVHTCVNEGAEVDAWRPVSVGVPEGLTPVECAEWQRGLSGFAWPSEPKWARGDAFGWQFTAPPGTRITGFRAKAWGYSGSGRVTVGGPWFRGLWDPDSAQQWPFPTSYGDPEQFFALGALSSQRLAFGLRCPDPICRFDGWWVQSSPNGTQIWQGDYKQEVIARDITVTIRDDELPKIGAVRPVPTGWVREGSFPVTYTATDNVGVAVVRLRIGDTNFSTEPRACYDEYRNTSSRPCAEPLAPVTGLLDVTKLREGVNALSVSATDASGNTASQPLEIRVDRVAPAAPRGVESADADVWRTTNRFRLRWVNPATEGTAPIEGAEYELCPATNAPYEPSGCVSGRRDGLTINEIDDLTVPGPGEWRMRVWLRDAAGNADGASGAVLGTLRLDSEMPNGTFLPFEVSDPARVQVSASDDTSGVASVEIEARRRGGNVWHSLAIEPAGGRYTGLLDDDQLVDGTYDLRARITDRAGNQRTITQLPDGTPLAATLPIRGATTLSVGHPERVRVSAKRKKPRYRRVLVSKPRARYGEPVEIEGRLTDAAGNPRAGETIKVLERVALPGRDWSPLAQVTTQKSGAFTFRALPGPARVLRFMYPGNATTRPRSEDVELIVSAGISVRPSKRRVRNGDEIVFRGRVLGGPIPEAGKLLALQAHTVKGWRTFATPRARASDGRFSARYRFTSTAVTTKYAFRVVVPQESSYPYARGVSATTKVTVRGG